jgi:hypothetical protein
MELQVRSLGHSRRNVAATAIAAIALVMVSGSAAPPQFGSAAPDPCMQAAKQVQKSCKQGAMADYWLAIGICENISDPFERDACREEAADDLKEALMECPEQYQARLDVCDQLGGGFYEPEIDPANFVAVIDNPHMPLIPGTTMIYEGRTSRGLERVEVEVTYETKDILGVTCTVVRDRGFLDGVLTEDTDDWFAQDIEGNVWYFGEISKNYEDGELVDIEGSWKAGEDGAQPGIVMLAKPVLRQLYRQEYFLGEAEDVGRLIALNEMVTVPYGMFSMCWRTEDFSPIEPDALENKLYAPGIGLVLEIDLESGDVIELIDIVYP